MYEPLRVAINVHNIINYSILPRDALQGVLVPQ